MRSSAEDPVDRSKDNGQEEFGTHQNRSSLNYNKSDTTVVIVAVLAILMTLDILAYSYISSLIFSQIGLENLNFQSPYVGLEPSHYNRTINMPRSVVQVYETDPDKVSPQGRHQWLSDVGKLAHPDRHLQVNKTVRTLIQFKVMNLGMQKCSLALRLPTRTSMTLPHPASMEDGSLQNLSLRVCQLDTVRTDLERISWNNRPRCHKDTDTVTLLHGTEFASEPLACTPGSHMSFEISCAPDNPSCHVDVWSNQNATWGMFMYQY